MGRVSSSFRESDLKRALRGIEAAGKQAAAVEIEGGVIKIRIKDGKHAIDNDDTDTPETAEDLRKLI